MKLFSFYVYREKAGVISRDPIWVCFYGSWMHTGTTLIGLLWNVITQYKNDQNLIE